MSAQFEREQSEAGEFSGQTDNSARTGSRLTSALKQWREGAFAPVDIASLAFFRVVFGLLMMVEVVRYFAHHSFSTKLQNRAFAPLDIASLVFFRIAPPAARICC